MGYNTAQLGGTPKSSKADSGNTNPFTVPVFAIVKDNIDPIRAGRIRVYVSDWSGLDPDDSSSWLTVNLLTPFMGHTEGDPENDDAGEQIGSFLQNPSAYGFWYSPPDLESTVIVIFVNGDPNYGFYIGGTPRGEVLHTLAGVGGERKVKMNPGEAAILGGSPKLPVTNIHSSLAKKESFLKETKPVHSYLAATLNQQGLIRDINRGVIGSYAQRESPSRLGFGVLTPGRPIYRGGYKDDDFPGVLPGASDESLQVIARRVGHTIVMDDGNLVGKDQLMRFRTGTGHQILMNDSDQCLFIIHANGQSWLEFGKEGTIDLYSTNSFNVRTHGDINFHADRDINFHAERNINAVAGKNAFIDVAYETKLRSGCNFKGYVKGSFTLKVNKEMSIESTGTASLGSKATTYMTGSKIMFNSGSASLKPESFMGIPRVFYPDTLFSPDKGFYVQPNHMYSITTRLPTHQPFWAAGMGIPVSVDLTDTTTKDGGEVKVPPPKSSSPLGLNGIPGGIEQVATLSKNDDTQSPPQQNDRLDNFNKNAVNNSAVTPSSPTAAAAVDRA